MRGGTAYHQGLDALAISTVADSGSKDEAGADCDQVNVVLLAVVPCCLLCCDLKNCHPNRQMCDTGK